MDRSGRVEVLVYFGKIYLDLLSNCTSQSTNNAQYEYKYHAVFVPPENRLDRFPAVDQSVSWISRANFVPPRILLSRIPRK